jgi:hypothetical protein
MQFKTSTGYQLEWCWDNNVHLDADVWIGEVIWDSIVLHCNSALQQEVTMLRLLSYE